jgi:hypothetical protein
MNKSLDTQKVEYLHKWCTQLEKDDYLQTLRRDKEVMTLARRNGILLGRMIIQSPTIFTPADVECYHRAWDTLSGILETTYVGSNALPAISEQTLLMLESEMKKRCEEQLRT